MIYTNVMRVYQQQYSDISIYKSPSKTRLKEHNEQYSGKNKEELQQVRPAGQTSLSGSERSGDISFTGDPRLVTKIAKEALSGSDFSNVSGWAKKMGGAGWFDKVLKSVNENEAFYEAITALVVAGMLKPVCVLAMPGAEKEDKQMSATKNAVSAGAGFIISNLILGPCSKAVNRITDSFETSNPTKYIKNAEYVKELTNDELIEYTTKSGATKKLKSTLGDAFKTAYKKFPDMGVSPLKASITIALTPYVLNILFGKDKKKDKAPKADKMPVMNSIKLMKNQKEQKQDLPVQNVQTGENTLSKGINEKNAPVQNLGAKTQNSPAFKGITGKSIPVQNYKEQNNQGAGANGGIAHTQNTNYKEQNNPFTSVQPSFTGGVDQTIQIVKEIPKKKGLFTRAMDAYGNTLSKPLAKIMGKLANTAPSKKLVQSAAKFDKPTARFSDLASFSITYFYVNNTRKSEKIEEERKLPLMINNVMVTAASSTAAFLIDKYTDKPMENLLRGYLKKHDADIYNKSNRNIKNTLQNMLETVKNGGKVDKVDVDKLMKHSDDLLSGGVENLSDNFKEALKALTNDSTVKDAVKQGIIKQEDITKIAASGYEKVASSTFKNISKAKSLTVFTLTVRFLVTVLMTPVVGKVVSIVNKKLGREKPKEETENKKQETAIGMNDFQNLTK